MSRVAIISTLTIIALIGWQSFAVWSMLQSCSTRAHALIDAADPLDRNPPAQVKNVVERNIQLDQLLDLLATVLLDRYGCRGGANWSAGTDWLIDHPLLVRRLRASFGKTEIIALFATTADMGKGDIGLSRGARRIYQQEISQLDEVSVTCLFLRAFGKQPPPFPPRLDSIPEPYYPACPSDGGVPRPILLGRPPGRDLQE